MPRKAMVRKALMAALLAFQPSYTALASVPVTLLEPVPLVVCGDSAGSAFRVGPNLLLSVKHVTTLRGCVIDGDPIHISYSSSKADFSMLSDDRRGKWLKVDCDGFIPGRKYVAIGHARGLDALVAVSLVATGERSSDGLAILVGVFTAQPGQSGGPVIDAETHEVVGTVNAANWEEGTTFSVELKGTSVCGGNIA